MPLIYREGRKKALIWLEKEIKEPLKDELPALLPALSIEQLKRKYKPFSTVPFSRDPYFVDCPDSYY